MNPAIACAGRTRVDRSCAKERGTITLLSCQVSSSRSLQVQQCEQQSQRLSLSDGTHDAIADQQPRPGSDRRKRVRDGEVGIDRDTQGMDYSAARDVHNGHAAERSIVSSRG
jgi:hypothetical protein